jgi:hypothetical protein
VTITVTSNEGRRLLRRIRLLIAIEIVGLVVSGLSALPLAWGAQILYDWFGPHSSIGAAWPAMADWVLASSEAIFAIDASFPFVFYGTDWLAFGHFVIAIAFIGAWRDPVRNRWVIEFGMIACLLVVPFAFLMGEIRGIPVFWRVIDSMFGLLGFVPLLLARREVVKLT